MKKLFNPFANIFSILALTGLIELGIFTFFQRDTLILLGAGLCSVLLGGFFHVAIWISNRRLERETEVAAEKFARYISRDGDTDSSNFESGS